MEKLKTMSIKQKLIILFSLLTLVLVGIILLVPRNSRFSIAKLANNYNADGDEVTAFVITVRDANDNSIVLSNSRFVIKELTIVNDVEYESDPVDIYGNVLGTEEVVNGETVRVFETDVNGVIEANFRDGNYKIEQIEAKNGYKVSAVQYFGVNAERGSNVELVSEEPLYTGNTDANSTPDSFCVEGRSDGSALYYNVGYLSYVDSTNQVVWTEYSDLVYEIIARDDGFDVLTDSQIVQYDNSGNITNTIEVAYGMRSFKKDATGNFVITGTFYGSLSIDSSSTTSGSSITLSSTSYTDDMYVLTLDSNNLVSSAYSIEGDYSEIPRTLAITTDGNYVISYVVDTYEYNIVKVNSSTGATIATVETDISGRTFDLVHYVAAGSDGSVYYGGNYSGTLSYAASETANGTAITLTSNDEDGVVIKYDSNMKILWAINLGGAGGDHFFKADTTEDGGFVMGGDSDTGAITIAAEDSQSGYSITSTPESENVGTWRGITVKVNSDGKAVWAKEFGYSSNEGMYAITTFTNDSFALCGFETANSTRNAVLIRVNEEVIEEEIEAMTSLDVYNEPITYNITTEVTGEGGTISGQDDTVYETVDWQADATKEIVVAANTGYVIKSITIQKTDDEGTVTTENVTVDAETKTYTLTPFTNLNENIHVIAEFEKLEAKVIVHHYITGTTTQVPGRYSGTVADEEYIGTVGETYTTEAASTSEISRYYSLSGTPDNATGTYIEGTIEVIYYYDPTNYSYTIYYYYDGTEDTSKRETLQAGYGTQVTNYPDKAGIGYKLDSTTNVPLTITASTYSNRMRIYYVTDEEQRKDLTYTVEYYKDGNIVSADTQTVTENVQVLEADTLTVDKTTINTTDKYEGYTLESTSPTTIPDTIDSGETIKVYYVKRTDLSYTVNYYEEGTTTKVATSKVVNNQTFDNQVTEIAIDVAGYNKVGDTESTITIEVSGNEINFYYTKRTDLSYTVKYLEQGTNAELASTKTVNNQTYKSTTTESAIDITGYDKVDPTTASITIEVSRNEIVFYYTKRTDLSYTVKYLEQATNAELASTKTVNGQTYKSVVTENAIDITGYDKVSPITANITIEVAGNEIVFYYTKRTDLSYTVKYLEKDTDAELASAKVVDGQTFKSTATEEAIEISGYDKTNLEETITIEVTGNEIKFYYTKRTDLSYTVKYLEKDTDAELASAKVVDGQTFKSTATEEAIEISGYDKTNLEETITIEVTGNEIKFYYTKRTDLSYTVKYLEKDTDAELASAKVVDGQTFKSTATEEAIDITGYDKVNPTTANITIEVSGNEIVFYYTKRVDLSYTVKYLEQGTNTELASTKTVNNQTYKSTATESAIDITGYDKVNPTTANITIEVSGNEIVFYYTKRVDLSYTVKYLEEGTDKELSTEKVVNSQTYKSEVTEQAIDIEGYTKINPQETITIEVSGNEIIFYYKKVEGLSYTVNYYEKGTTTSVATSKTVDGNVFEDVVTESAIDIEGYNKVNPTEQTITIGVGENIINFYYEKRTDLSYTVKYLEKDTDVELTTEKVVGGQTFKSVVTENAIDIEGYDKVNPTTANITIEVSGNEIVFYYTKRADLSYTVKYLEQDTNKELSTEKVVNGQIYKSLVTENAIEISGYDKVNPTTANITIEVSGNEIVFYYTKRTDLSYTVKYLEDGTEKELSSEKIVDNQTYKSVVTENAIDIEGYDKVNPTTANITIEVSGNEIVFYYTKRTDLSYTVKYLEEGTNKKLSTEKVVTDQTFKLEVTEQAIDITGYTKVNSEETITIEVSGNEIIFYYKKVEGLSYTVNYYEEGTTTSVATSKIVDGKTFEEEVTENSIDVEGYDKVAPTEKTIVIGVGENVINFYYTKRVDLSYTVKYLEKDTDIELADVKVVDGQTYKSTVKEESIEISGYDKTNLEETITIEVTGNEIVFYYTKRTDLSYTVKYLEQDTNKELSTEKVVDGQTYKSTVKEEAIEISGYDKTNIEETITIEVTGNEIIFYYKKVEGLSYTVNYFEEGTQTKVAPSKTVDGKIFEDKITESAIDVEGYNKVNPTESSIVIGVGENVINFYYTKRTDLSYTVKYLEKDTNIELLTEKVVDGQTFKSTATENAVEITGYDKVDPTEQTITIEVTGNEIVFYYTKRTDLSYTVKYLEKDTDAVLATEKIVDGQTFKSIATENAVEITGYDKVDPTEQTITIEVTGNEITFYYTKRTDLSYTVKYLEQDTNKELATEKVVDGQTYKSTVKEEAIEISGYDKTNLEETITIEVTGNEITFYYTKRTDLSYTVKYLEQDTNKELATEKVVDSQTYKSEIEEQAIDITGYTKVNPEETITIEVAGNEIIFYYKKVEGLSYTVNYFEEGTQTKVAPSKTVDGKIFEDKITESAIDVEGYNKVDSTESSIVIGVGENVINFYYTKRIDLSYTVKYLEKDSNVELLPAKVMEEQTFKSEITESAINIEGYDKVNPTEQTITIEVTGNEIIFYYTKRTDLSYTVKYLEQGSDIELSLAKTIEGKTFQEQITETARDIEGYDKVGPTESTITIAVSGNEITFYYTKRTDLSYTVKYLEQDSDEVLLTEKVVNGKTFQETITEQSVEIAGYNKVNLEESIVMEVSGNEIIFYYTKKSDIEYKVEFYYEGNIDTSKTEVHQGTFKQIIDSYTDNNEVGYRLDEEKNFPLQISANSDENVIQIYYVIDDGQTKEIKYTVEYYKEGTLIDIDTQVNTKTVQVLDPEVLVVNKDDINLVDKYFGYRLDSTEPTQIPDEVNNGDVIKVYYVIDEANTKTLNYTVEYYKEGVLVEDDTQTVSETVQILQPDTLDVRKGEINTVNKYVGYKLQETTPNEIPDKIETGETIKVYYVIDENQRKDLSYTIEYYKDGQLQKDETKEVSINVQLLEPDTIPVNKAEMVLSGKYVGYKLEKTSPTEIPAIANNGDVIRIYYIKDQFNYTVEYYYDGNIDSTKTDTLTATYEDVIKEYTDKNIFGYRLEKTEGLPLKVSEKPEENVIKVYYIIDDGNTKTLNYTVEYYMDGVLQEGDTQLEYKTVQILQPDTFEVDKSKINLVDKYVGYRLEKTEPEGIPDVATTGDVYEVYYVKDTFGYRVEYYYEGQLVSEKTENLSALYESMIDVYPDKNNGKYYLDNTENFPMKVTEISSNNVIKVYYEKKLSTITVHYYWDGINNTNNKEVDDKKRTLGEDVDNGEIKEKGRVSVSQDVIIEDKVDTVHKIVAASDVADKYELISKPVSEEITMTVEPQEFEYIYRLKNAKVTVNFIEVGTGKILGTKVMEGQVDDRYHAVPDSIHGFSLRNDKIPENEVGKMTLEPITVNFYYDANPQGVGTTQTATPAEKTEYKGNGPATGDAEIIVCMAIVLAILAINISQGKILKVNTKEKVNGGKKEKLVGKRHSSQEPIKVARVSRLERNCKKSATKRVRKH